MPLLKTNNLLNNKNFNTAVEKKSEKWPILWAGAEVSVTFYVNVYATYPKMIIIHEYAMYNEGREKKAGMWVRKCPLFSSTKNGPPDIKKNLDFSFFWKTCSGFDPRDPSQARAGALCLQSAPRAEASHSTPEVS